MAEPKEEKIEKKLEETGAPNPDSELSDADFEKVSGGVCQVSAGHVEASGPTCLHET
jgi:hypothetical protein